METIHKNVSKIPGKKNKEIYHEQTQEYDNFDCTCKNSKLFKIDTSKKTCGMKFTDYLSLPFLYQPQSDVVVSIFIYFDKYKDLVTERKNKISINGIVTFIETSENVLT